MKVAENGICIMMNRSHMRPSYRDHCGDPVRWLLAAVVYRAIRDCSPKLKVSAEDRASAEWFLSGEEGLAWLRTFGISDQKARNFVNRISGGV
jgi:hypothetical protein